MNKSAVRKDIKKNRFSYVDVLKNLFPWKGDPRSEKIRKTVFMIAVIIFGVCAYLIFNYFYGNYKNNKMYEGLQEDMPSLAEMITPEVTNVVGSSEMLPYMQKMIEKIGNDDIVGWIQIPDKNGKCDDTKVDYPIVQKTTEDEREFYLRHNIYKEYTGDVPGSIFLDWRNKLGTPDQSDNLVIYGHEMKDGSMFGNLSKYDDYYSFYGEHPCIELSSRYEVSTYKIFGFFYGDSGETESEFHYFNTINFNSEQEFYDYVNEIKRRSLIINGVDVKYGDDLLVLSTCATGYYDKARFAVAARKVRPGEDKYAGTQDSSRNENALMPIEWYKAKGDGITYDSNAEFIPYG